MAMYRKVLAGCFGLAAMVVGACAPMTDFVTLDEKAFSQAQATEVFAAAYGGVADKYIDPVNVRDIAFEGIRGLGAIDPGLTIQENGATIVLSDSGRKITSFETPKADDVKGWAELTAKISSAAREESAEMKSTDMETIFEAVFDGMLSNLDIFSRYAGAQEAERNRSKRDGFGGIGIRYRVRDGIPVITEVLKKTPAAKSGLRKDDRITHVDATPLSGLSRHEISRKLRGPTHTRVELTVARGDNPAPVIIAMERAHIFAATVEHSTKDGIVYFKVKSFNQDTARSLAEKLRKARLDLGDGMKGMVIDLRGNPGGLLKQSVKVADLLLTQGQIVSTRGRHADSIHHYEASGRDLADGLPLVVLVDGKSASAAEIVAAALQDRDRAVVIGTTSFGKGSVQTVLRLPNDGEITLTWSRLIAPSGYMFHGLGIRPAICTSGVKGAARDAIKKGFANRSKTEETFVAWRQPGLRVEPKRSQLRATCPSQRRRDDFEMQVARQVLNDQALYNRALTFTAATNEARY
ncbi:MAG: PDZ domain-containing protein [Rhodospirillales bacterium]|nr:PDZ domain-containing protein [Rhodospirillales bacterium]